MFCCCWPPSHCSCSQPAHPEPEATSVSEVERLFGVILIALHAEHEAAAKPYDRYLAITITIVEYAYQTYLEYVARPNNV